MKDTKNTKLIELIEDGENQISMLQELICFKKVKNRNSNDIKEISLNDLLAISKADIPAIIIQRIKDSLILESKDYLTENKTEDGYIYVMPDNSCLSKILDESKKDLNEKDFRFLLKECSISSIFVDKIKVLIDEESLNHFSTLSEKRTEELAGDCRGNNNDINYNSSAVKILIEDYKENYIFPVVKIAFEISSGRTGPMSDYLSNLEISFSRDGIATTNYSFTKDYGYHKTIQRCIHLINEKYKKIAKDKADDLEKVLAFLTSDR
jgi:hypothetical protein